MRRSLINSFKCIRSYHSTACTKQPEKNICLVLEQDGPVNVCIIIIYNPNLFLYHHRLFLTVLPQKRAFYFYHSSTTKPTEPLNFLQSPNFPSCELAINLACPRFIDAISRLSDPIFFTVRQPSASWWTSAPRYQVPTIMWTSNSPVKYQPTHERVSLRKVFHELCSNNFRHIPKAAYWIWVTIIFYHKVDHKPVPTAYKWIIYQYLYQAEKLENRKTQTACYYYGDLL